MTGIPTPSFDYFNLSEIPTFILCNPNKERLYALGGISERKYSARYNAISELSFRADEYVDEILMPYYSYLTNRRLIEVENIGYFMITEVNENNDGIVKYKEIGCQSLEIELASRKLTGFVSGSGIYDETGTLVSTSPKPVTFTQLYMELLPYFPGWVMEIVPERLDTEYRSFDVSDTTLYNLLMVEVEEAYECIFEFDTVNDLIIPRDATEEIEVTDIFISHDNVIKSMTVEEVTDGLATCLYVVGGGGLDITPVNPLGNNYIYDFSYFESTDWMEQSLIDSLMDWENKFTINQPLYRNERLLFIEDNDHLDEHAVQLNIVSGSILYNDRLYDAFLASGCSSTDPAMIEIQNTIDTLSASQVVLLNHMGDIQGEMDAHFDILEDISDGLKFTNTDNFSTSQQAQLQPFIIQSSYVNDNFIKIDTMTSACVAYHAQRLYTQARSVLSKTAAPTYRFEIDSVSFLQIKELENFASQLDLGKKITLEVKEGVYLQPTLLGVDMDFDNPENFKLIFGNRMRLDDETFQFNDLMNKALSAGTTMSLKSVEFNDWTRDYKTDVKTLMEGVMVEGIQPSEGITISPDVINLQTTSLQWNHIPLDLYFAGGGGSGSGLASIMITLFSGGQSVSMYEPTSDGLDEAIAAASSGDVIFLPDVDIDGNFSIPAGVNLVGVSSRETIINGQVTIEPGSLLENLSVLNQQNSSTEIMAVVVQETTETDETCNIKGCEIRCYQCGAGTTHAVYIADAGVDLVVENSTIIADSNGGGGYAFSNNGGSCSVYHSQYYAKTEVFHDL